MSLATVGYREVQKIVSSWTNKYQYHISLMQTKQELVKFMVEFSLTTPQKPIPIGTVRVYFSCKNLNDELDVTFRFQKDSLIHSVDQTIRHKQLQKWIDDALSKKLLVRETVFYLGTSYEQSRVLDPRLDKILQTHPTPITPQYIYIHPQLLSDQSHSILIHQQPLSVSSHHQSIQKKVHSYWSQVDTDNLEVVTYVELRKILKNIGVQLTEDQIKEVEKKVDQKETGTVRYQDFQIIAAEIVEGLEIKKIAETRLKEQKDQEVFGSILNLINDQAQNIQSLLNEKFRAKDEDQTGITSIQQVKAILQFVNVSTKQKKFQQPLSPIQMAQITKILTDLYGYKQIPYAKVHKHMIDLKISNFSKGRVSANMNNLQVYLRDIFDAYDEKKFGRIQLKSLIEALQKCQKIKLTKAQIYVLESIIPKDAKNQVNYIQMSKFLSEIIKKLYIYSSKKRIDPAIQSTVQSVKLVEPVHSVEPVKPIETVNSVEPASV